jgi:hypothetical protein
MKSRKICLWSVIIISMLSLGISPIEAGVQETMQSGELAESNESNMIHRMGRELARSLSGQEARAWLREALSTSPYVEDRVALNRVLRSQAAVRGLLLGYEPEDMSWKSILEQLHDLELYFPFEEHRSSWEGEEEIWVAVPIEGSDQLVVYSSNGSYWKTFPDYVPVVPTLILAQSEIDYDDLPSSLKGGSRTGPYLRSLSGDHEPALLSTPDLRKSLDTSRHSYLTYLLVTEDHDPWRGAMEIDVFGSIDGGYADCARVSYVLEDYPLDMGPLVPNAYRVAKGFPYGQTETLVEVWEDDDTACVEKSGDDKIGHVYVQGDEYGSIWSTEYFHDAFIEILAPPSICGDGTCEDDERCFNCSSDCGTCPYCGDGDCNGTEYCVSCPGDCGACGCNYNGICESGENQSSCPEDCCVDYPECPE